MPGVMTIVQPGRSVMREKCYKKLTTKKWKPEWRELKKSELWNRNFGIARLFYQILDVIAGLLGSRGTCHNLL